MIPHQVSYRCVSLDSPSFVIDIQCVSLDSLSFVRCSGFLKVFPSFVIHVYHIQCVSLDSLSFVSLSREI